jgi:hypothetical protein
MSRKLTMALMALLLGVVQPGTAVLRAQGPREGIKVHGHWTIDVRQPDGTLVQHHEFENALVGSQTFLAQVLGRQGVPGLWTIALESLGPAKVCLGGRCSIVESNSSFGPNPEVVHTLTVGVTNGNALLLSGTATADTTGFIDQVETFFSMCAPNIATANCQDAVSSNTGALTRASISPMNIVAGQIMQVTVTISFS